MSSFLRYAADVGGRSGCRNEEENMTTKLPIYELLDRLWIDLAGQPYLDLTKGKTLRAVHHEVAFVLAGPDVELSAAVDEARMFQNTLDVPVLLILIDDADMQMIDAAYGWDGTTPWTYSVPVRDIEMRGVGAIRLNAIDGTSSPCEHGYMAQHTTVARILHKGDLFMISERNDDKLLLVYRALADYDRRKDRVLFERTTPGLEQPSKQYMELPPNLLVYVSWEEIEEAQPLSYDEAEMIAKGD
jgi:hypothetical protein